MGGGGVCVIMYALKGRRLGNTGQYTGSTSATSAFPGHTSRLKPLINNTQGSCRRTKDIQRLSICLTQQTKNRTTKSIEETKNETEKSINFHNKIGFKILEKEVVSKIDATPNAAERPPPPLPHPPKKKFLKK